VDSDCDGIGDVAELRAGGDPNSGAPDAGEVSAACAEAFEPPRYGCYCSVGRSRFTAAPLWFLLTVALLAARRRVQ
jgi:hypothetical protein